MCENNFSDDYEEDHLRNVLEYCDECSIYGDDYSFNDDGEIRLWVCRCFRKEECMKKKRKKNKGKLTDYIVFTDGGYAYNPGGSGAYAAIVRNRRTREMKEYVKAYQSTTNNRMEIMAVIMALENISSGSVSIYSDSQYVINTMTGKFRKKTN